MDIFSYIFYDIRKKGAPLSQNANIETLSIGND